MKMQPIKKDGPIKIEEIAESLIVEKATNKQIKKNSREFDYTVYFRLYLAFTLRNYVYVLGLRINHLVITFFHCANFSINVIFVPITLFFL